MKSQHDGSQSSSRVRLFIAAMLQSMLLLSPMASASVIGVAFDNGNGLPANWNAASDNGTIMNLINEDGAATGVDMTIANYFVPFNFTPSAGTIPQHTNSLSALNTYRQPEVDEDSFVFSGLDTVVTYKVWAIGLRGSGYTNEWTITGLTSTSFTQSGTGGQLTFNSHLGDSSSSFDSFALAMLPSVSGEISFDLTGTGGTGVGRIAGFAIEAVEASQIPEPSTMAIFCLGLVGFAGARFRRYRLGNLPG